jgi:methyl-accepting chemotaxis protein
MSLNEYLIIAVGAVILLLIYYIFSRDAHHSRQIRAIATAVESLNHQLFTLEQQFNENLKNLQSHSDEYINDADLRYELEVGISEQTKPLSESLQQIQSDFSQSRDQLQQRIIQLEENLRALSLPASVNGMDDERIITLYKQGVDLETISKELRLSKPEVEFVLKINQLK